MSIAATYYTPVGEYLRFVIMKSLEPAPLAVAEVEKIAEETIRKLGIKYDWRVWPSLFDGEVEIREGYVYLTPMGRIILTKAEKTAGQIRDMLGRLSRQVPPQGPV